MRMTIYMPDGLAEAVKQHDDLNVSAVCQEALRHELARRAELAKLDENMERVEVYASESHGGGVAFVGKEIYYDGQQVTAYLTRRHRIAIHHNDEQALHVYDSFGDMVAVWEHLDPKLVSEVAEELGEKHVVELDI